jgi:endoglucanase
MLLNTLKNIRLRFAARVLLLVLPVSLISLQGNAQGFLKADGKKIVDESCKNVLLRGMGLGGWMLQEGYMLHVNKDSRQYRIRERLEDLMGAAETKEFYDTWLANNTRKIDIDSMHRWGFNSVRLPMHYNLYTLPVEKEPVAGQNTWIDKGFQMTDALLAWCKTNHMYLILDLHAAPGGQGNDLNISDRNPDLPSLWNSEANRQKMIALWRKLADRYKNEPNIGGYDIINEPNWGFDDPANDKNGLKEKTNAPLRKLMVDITAAIRQVDKKHIIIIEGNGWGNNYNGILPTWDKNMVLSFHKYWNFNDQKSIEHIIKTRDQYNIPAWIGETGENSNVWLTEEIRLLEKNNLGWALWPLKKMGNNNPIEIPSNLNYDDVTRYLNPANTNQKKAMYTVAHSKWPFMPNLKTPLFIMM